MSPNGEGGGLHFRRFHSLTGFTALSMVSIHQFATSIFVV